LNLLDHLGNALHDVVAPEDRLTRCHQLGHAAAVADAFEDIGRDDRHGFGVVELEAARATTTRDLRGREDQQLLLLPRRQMHWGLLFDNCSRAGFAGATFLGEASEGAVEAPSDLNAQERAHLVDAERLPLALERHATLVHDVETIADLTREFQVLLDDENGPPSLLLDPLENGPDLLHDR